MVSGKQGKAKPKANKPKTATASERKAPRVQRRRKGSDLEEGFAYWVKVAKLPVPEREYQFHPTRKWRFDFAWPDKKIAVEMEGGVWIFGGHNRGGGYNKDCEKYNEAVKLGWKVLRFTADYLDIELLRELLYADQTK